MLNWDAEQVASVLGCEPEFQENSSYLFRFETPGGPATLSIFPFDNRIDLRIGIDDWASWQLDLSAIQFNDEIAEQGGQCLALIPQHPSSKEWIVISRNEETFNILTVFRSE